MLVALTEQNERFVLRTSTPKAMLKKLRDHHQFYCPQCKEQVQFKIGSIKIPHFAHQSNSQCDMYFSEPESEQHLLGKEQLLQMFSSQGFEVQLESYIPDLNQRPDLLVNTNSGITYAVEYQCSPLPSERFLLRNKGYKSLQISPIWIFATPPNLSSKMGIEKISLNEQLQQFVVRYHNQDFLMTYHPYSKKFYYFTNLLHVKGNSFLTKVLSITIDNQKFPFYLPKKLEESEFLQYYKSYLVTKTQYTKYRVLISRSGINDLFLRSIYELRLSQSNLPLFLGIPLKGNEELNTFSLEWQTALFYFMHLHCIMLHNMNRQASMHFLKWAKLKITNKTINLVLDYCRILQSLSIEHVYSPAEERQLINLLYAQFLA
nr:competence protein CoiA family protein [Lysinibacillus timonensis]